MQINDSANDSPLTRMKLIRVPCGKKSKPLKSGMKNIAESCISRAAHGAGDVLQQARACRIVPQARAGSSVN